MESLPRLYDAEEHDNFAAEEALGFLAQALREPLPSGRDLLAVVIPAPSEAVEKFLRLVPRTMGFLWHAPTGERFAGGGCVEAIVSRGDGRIGDLRKRVADLWSRLHVRVGNGDATALAPVLFGGIAFSPGVPPHEPWGEFEDLTFALPKWGYRRVGREAYLTLTVRKADLASSSAVADLVAEARRLVFALAAEAPTSLIQRPEIPSSAVHHIGLADWLAYMDEIHAAIKSGSYSKIVAARRCVVDLAQPLEDTGFMARLFAAYSHCTHFAIRRERTTFVGATPETLFRKTGSKLRTEALAGTTRVSDDPGSDSSVESAALRRSVKDLAEHALVVQRICQELYGLSKRIRYQSAPEVRQVRNLVHLHTPISADLKPDVSALDLLTALHPTPAVGGFPAADAARWIRDHEPLERGWYTGAVGWLDANGNAEFAVAIRCGVMTPSKVYIYAGAGIVEKSNPEAEYRETGAKMQPLLRALGVTG